MFSPNERQMVHLDRNEPRIPVPNGLIIRFFKLVEYALLFLIISDGLQYGNILGAGILRYHYIACYHMSFWPTGPQYLI